VRRKLYKATVVFVLGATIGSPLSAQMKPLTEILSGNYERSYPIVRCAAFYTSMVEWAGQQVGEETYDGFRDAVNALLLAGVLARAETSSDSFEHLLEIVMKDTRAIADLYLEDFRSSYASTGSAWENNPIWTQDLQSCEPLAQAAIQKEKDLGSK